jgi:CHAT domain-containing protein
MSVSGQGSEEKRRAMRINCGNSRGLEAVLSLLWNTIVQPIFDALGLNVSCTLIVVSLRISDGRARPRLWWCVTGELSFLPIHAAGSYCSASPVCTADYVISSYIPTLVSLTKARKSWTHIARSKLAGLLICEASTTESSAAYLSNVVDEVIAVHECFTSAGAHALNPPAAHTSISELYALLKNPAHILHMACHGIQHSDPLRSAFLLQDGRLSIEDVMQLNLPDAFLAFLSACHTAKGDHNAPDQAVHLAASMLYCGFRSVVGTMWYAYQNLHNIILLIFFYEGRCATRMALR